MSIIVPKGKTMTKNDKKTEKQSRKLKTKILGILVGLDLAQREITEA